jgi:hypothetical protein
MIGDFGDPIAEGRWQIHSPQNLTGRIEKQIVTFIFFRERDLAQDYLGGITLAICGSAIGDIKMLWNVQCLAS